MNLRIGTFNAQNLLKRAKALDLADEADTAAILGEVGAFHDPLEQTHCDTSANQLTWPALKVCIDINNAAFTCSKSMRLKSSIVATGVPERTASVRHLWRAPASLVMAPC